MNNILTNLIKQKFYANKEIAISKTDACFAMNRITQEQCSTLLLLIDEKYPTE